MTIDMHKQLLIVAALVLAIVFSICGIVRTHGGERMICQLEPQNDNWHYRTKVGGRAEKCWYEGQRMKPRNELYWAEAPEVAPMEVDRPPWARGAKPGWDHKE